MISLFRTSSISCNRNSIPFKKSPSHNFPVSSLPISKRFYSNSNLEPSDTLQEIENLLRKLNEKKTTKFVEESNLEENIETKIEPEFDEFALENLKYLQFYPRRIKQWVLDAKTPKGRFNHLGEWETVPISPEKNLNEKNEEEAKKIAREIKEKTFSRPIPEDLKNSYRFGVESEDLNDYSPKIKELFSFKYANQFEINKKRIGMMVNNFGKDKFDTGSPGVQVAVLTQKINYLTEHMKKNSKDLRTNYNLTKILNRRRRMMKYLKRTDVATYYKVLKGINLRDIIP